MEEHRCEAARPFHLKRLTKEYYTMKAIEMACDRIITYDADDFEPSETGNKDDHSAKSMKYNPACNHPRSVEHSPLDAAHFWAPLDASQIALERHGYEITGDISIVSPVCILPVHISS
jgi:hypothetical protein